VENHIIKLLFPQGDMKA